MSFPAEGSIRHKVCEILRDESMSRAQVRELLPMHTPCNVNVAIRSLCEDNLVTPCANSLFSLTGIMQKHLDQCEKVDAPKSVGQIVQPRIVNVFTSPLAGYAASLLRGKRDGIREVSFINGSSGLQGYRA